MRSLIVGLLASSALLGMYLGLLSVLSGWAYAQDQFQQFAGFILALDLGFGLQVGLFTHLRRQHQRASGKALAVTGGTSTTAMVSCCAHYLVNLIPLLGVTGLVTLVAQYQVELFWVGIMANILGLIYLWHKAKYPLPMSTVKATK